MIKTTTVLICIFIVGKFLTTKDGAQVLIQINTIFVKLIISLYPSVFTLVLGAQKNDHIETILLSTLNICFG